MADNPLNTKDNNRVDLNKQKEQGTVFPYKDSVERLELYQYFEKLFIGDHFDAFKLRVQHGQFNEKYAKLRYVMANYAGLLSRVVADMLFSETVGIKAPDGDQEFIEGLWEENNLDVQCYESALSNSFRGDALFKLRIGKRYPNDQKPSIIIEDITPEIYFPHMNGFNIRAVPEAQELAWTFRVGDNDYVRKEIHRPGMITNEVWRLEGDKLRTMVDLGILGDDAPPPVQPTKIDRSMLVHVPNYKIGNRWEGISDYYDLDSIFFAINNRMMSIDNILDKHSDPILMVPPGILDEDGNVRKQALGVLEMGEGEDGKPEYIVWDASLENAFKEVEQLIKLFEMIGEVSPDVFGMGEGMSDSGRALKFKLMRTLAKVQRKKLYYNVALKEVLYVAQKLAKAWGIEVKGKRLKSEPVVPELDWQDGLPIDNKEQIETEIQAIDAGLTSRKAAIMRAYNVDEKKAEELIKEADDETKIELPSMNMDKFNVDRAKGDSTSQA